MSEPTYTASELMIVVAARRLEGARTVFVGVGLPNIACHLARYTVAPDLELIYESGVYGARPERLPLSIGDPTLVSGAISVVSMADLFGLYLQRGLVEVALLGGAQIDRFGNLNTTVIGDYDKPKTRLPGAGGAPEIALHAKKIFVVLKQSPRSFVANLDFCTSAGFLNGNGERAQRAMPGAGPQAVITDMGILKPATRSQELTLVARYENVSVERIRAATGWPLAVADTIDVVAAPTAEELRVLRDLHKRTAIAHAGDARRSRKIPRAAAGQVNV